MEHLFKELTFSNGVKARNKFLLAPLTNMQSPDIGKLSNDEFNWLTKRAEGGFGIIMTCAMPVLKSGIGWKGQLSIYDPIHEEGHKRLNAELHRLESLSIAQIFHAGVRANMDYAGDKVGPSANLEKSARELSFAEIEKMKAAFVQCAVRAHECNYDGIEIHAAHGYLIGQFLSSKFNKREDVYGGSFDNRAKLLIELANLEQHPESVPINMLVHMEGTRLYDNEKVDELEFIRTIAISRIMMPKTYVRLSAGRESMADSMQALCFYAGANSVFYGEELLTAPNVTVEKDRALFNKLGMNIEGQESQIDELNKIKTPDVEKKQDFYNLKLIN